MTASEQIIERLARLLRDEIAAIGAGQLETVRDLYPEKLALFEEFEQESGAVEKKLRAGGEAAAKLRESLEQLNILIRKDYSLLSQITSATERVAKELARIRDRHGLGGIYEASGTLRKGNVAPPQQVDQSI